MLVTETQARDVSILTTDGLTLLGRHWSRPTPRAVVVVSHGFGEHGGAYDHVAAAIGPAVGVDFLAPDFRGHGRSPGRRGVVRSFNELVSDLDAALDWCGRALPGIPRFVLGHSNGGQVALRAVLNPAVRDKIAGLILSNPSIRLATYVPRYKILLGRFLLKVAPSLTLPASLASEAMTSDPAMQALHRDDLLRHGRMSPPFYFGMVEGGKMIADRASEITTPVFLLIGGSDPVVDPTETRLVFDRLGSTDKTLMLYPRMLHEPLNDLGRERVFEDVEAWLRARLP
jgi:alpha-beta hydrolase superfamily lysophospholipase